MGVITSRVFTLYLIAVVTPLILILIAILLSGWFNIWSNALSDLGHATESNVAPLFNFGLAFSGYMLGLLSFKYMIRYNNVKSYLLAVMGFLLLLISVYDEVYGKLHFIVSIAFFTSLIVYLIHDGVYKRSLLPLIFGLLQIVVWIVKFLYNTPPGLAIPELLSIFLTIPFVMQDVYDCSKLLK